MSLGTNGEYSHIQCPPRFTSRFVTTFFVMISRRIVPLTGMSDPRSSLPLANLRYGGLKGCKSGITVSASTLGHLTHTQSLLGNSSTGASMDDAALNGRLMALGISPP